MPLSVSPLCSPSERTASICLGLLDGSSLWVPAAIVWSPDFRVYLCPWTVRWTLSTSSFGTFLPSRSMDTACHVPVNFFSSPDAPSPAGLSAASSSPAASATNTVFVMIDLLGQVGSRPTAYPREPHRQAVSYRMG